MLQSEARKAFVEKWAHLHGVWGSSKSVGRVHGLLLISDDPLCTDTIMEVLSSARGSVHCAVKTLTEFGLIHKLDKEGCRKDYFVAEKNVYKMFVSVVELRRKREMSPLLDAMQSLIEEHGSTKDTAFKNIVHDMYDFSKVVDHSLDQALQADPKWLFTSYLSKRGKE